MSTGRSSFGTEGNKVFTDSHLGSCADFSNRVNLANQIQILQAKFKYIYRIRICVNIFFVDTEYVAGTNIRNVQFCDWSGVRSQSC